MKSSRSITALKETQNTHCRTSLD